MIKKYEPIEDPFIDNDENKIRRIVYSLPTADRNIILLYWEFGTVRAVAKALHVSDNLVMNRIMEIKRDIKERW